MVDNVIDLSSDTSSDSTYPSAAAVKAITAKYCPLSDESMPGPSGIERPQKRTIDNTEGTTKNKSNLAAEKQLKKQKIVEEKTAKKIANDLNKIYKPGECMKYMNVEGHPSLWSTWWCSDVSSEVTAVGAKLVPSPELCHPSLVVWTRNVPRTLDKESGQLKLTPSVEACDRALYVSPAEHVAELVTAHSLAPHLADIQTLADRALTLVLFGVKDYFKSPGRQTTNSTKTRMTEMELELAITDLLVSSNCDTAIVNTPNEFALLVVQFTKAIAEAPYKRAHRACEDQASFYMRGDSRKCVAVDKDGVAVGKLWQQMIAILPNSSLEVSRALCAKYKSPRVLYEALQSPDSVTEVADIGVSRAAVPGSKARRVGPEFARKLRILFTARDGNTLVN